LIISNLWFFNEEPVSKRQSIDAIWDRKQYCRIILRIPSCAYSKKKIQQVKDTLRYRDIVGFFPTNIAMKSSSYKWREEVDLAFECEWRKHATEKWSGDDYMVASRIAILFRLYAKGNLVDIDTQIERAAALTGDY
jgi:hypothetical protein